MTLDRHDRKMLLRFHEEGPRFILGAAELRAHVLYQDGLLDREWRIYSSTPKRRSYAWRYRLSAKGIATVRELTQRQGEGS